MTYHAYHEMIFSRKFLTSDYRFIDVDECESKDSNSCHEYATCKDVVGTYICTCFEGFFGDGEECKGKTKVLL